jgi:hypothetical protein
LLYLALLAAPTRADDFDRLEGRALTDTPKTSTTPPLDHLTLAELGNLPTPLRSLRSPVLIIKTDQGNLARLMASFAFRKPPTNQGEPKPILVLERFETLEAGPATTKLARGRDLVLFDGFRYDLDTGQVVPDGEGGDLQFVAKADGGPRLLATGGAKIYPLMTAPPLDIPGKPSAGRAVLPTDFAGRYRLFANGQMSGLLELKVGEGGIITGRFASDQTGTSYPVTGQVGPEAPERVHFAITFPRSRQDFDGRLWTEGKGAMAGSMTMLNHDYGFFAVREEARFAPEDAPVGTLEKSSDKAR